jgi:putative transposase
MTRIARVVVPGLPHHVTQRGNRRQRTFFKASDYNDYLELLHTWTRRTGVSVWCYCLMPNHVHLIAVPDEPDALRACLSQVHRRYTRRVNAREDWRGYLWQGRFASVPMDERHTIAAARYIIMNPVRANLVEHAADWPWSSARAFLEGRDDLHLPALHHDVGAWTASTPLQDADFAKRLHMQTRTGRPLGDAAFTRSIELKMDRVVSPRRRGRPRRKS